MSNTESIKSKLRPFVGTKKIKATPMTWGQYCELRELKPVEDEASGSVALSPAPVPTPQTLGYLVEYPDAEHRNDARFDGYGTSAGDMVTISWSPSKVFDESYQPAETEQDLIKIEIRRTEAEMERLQNRVNVEIHHSDHQLVKIQISMMQAYLQVLYARFFNLSTVKFTPNK